MEITFQKVTNNVFVGKIFRKTITNDERNGMSVENGHVSRVEETVFTGIYEGTKQSIICIDVRDLKSKYLIKEYILRFY